MTCGNCMKFKFQFSYKKEKLDWNTTVLTCLNDVCGGFDATMAETQVCGRDRTTPQAGALGSLTLCRNGSPAPGLSGEAEGTHTTTAQSKVVNATSTHRTDMF